MLVALEQEYRDRPQLSLKIKSRIEERIEEQTTEIQIKLAEKYMLDDVN